jgi:DNA topoisomerase-1
MILNRLTKQFLLGKKASSKVFLATDLDREGEAIAWHLVKALKIKSSQARRVVFNAITKAAIQHAFANAQDLDIDKVNAQQARRILDRIVGYEISPLLWKKVARGLSAGRVQSVAVKLIVEREREILAFVPEEFWKITGIFSTQGNGDLASKYMQFLDLHKDKPPTSSQKVKWLTEHGSLEAQLMTFNGENFRPDNETDTLKIHKSLENKDFKITDVQTKRSNSNPPPPFITSTLQQQASTKLRFSTRQTMRIAQQLYEGIELTNQGSVGLITYMRTDSTHLAKEAVDSARQFITDTFGDHFLQNKPNFYGNNKKSAQEAHEAIRPTDVGIMPESLKKDLDPKQFKLYELIWKRFVACQMAPAQWDITTVEITSETELGEAVFKASGRKLVFEGFMKVAGMMFTNGDQILPSLSPDQTVWPIRMTPSQHFTSAPPRYTEASLVKMLESEGIGRPSTYASIISTIQDRGYVEQLERKFHATDLGMVVTDKLNDHFPRVMDTAFTSHMEEQLDKIEEQHLNWVEVLKEFYGPFKENLDRAHEEMNHAKAETQPSEYSCPECESAMVYRFGKNGRFLSCSRYPECKFSAPCDREGKMLEPQETEHKCPKCGQAMILRKGRFGEFLGCSAYPECKTTQQMDKEGNVLPPKPEPKPSGIRCYKCEEGELVIRESKRGPFLGCGRFPKCRTIISIKQLDHLKELQAQGVWPPKTQEEADELLGRTKKGEKDKSKSTSKKKTATAKKKATKKVAKKHTAKKAASKAS